MTIATLSNLGLEGAAHIVQLSLAPVFLLSGVAALLNVFASRLSKVGDQVDALAAEPSGSDLREARLRRLRLRSRVLDWAVVLAAIGGVETCVTVLLLFLGEVLGRSAGGVLFFFFGGAIVFTMGALLAFVIEMLLAGGGVRRLVDLKVGD